jgi:hypothetical protein
VDPAAAAAADGSDDDDDEGEEAGGGVAGESMYHTCLFVRLDVSG